MYRLTALGIALFVLAAACSSSGDAVTGTVTKIDRKGLPENAAVQVELRDTSLPVARHDRAKFACVSGGQG